MENRQFLLFDVFDMFDSFAYKSCVVEIYERLYIMGTEH